MTINSSIIAEMAEEMTYDTSTGTGSAQSMGTLEFNPVIMIFDNQSTVAVEIGNSSSTTWRTFPAGEGLVLDLRGNHGIADNYTFRRGMEIFATSGVGAGNFSVSYVYADPTVL